MASREKGVGVGLTQSGTEDKKKFTIEKLRVNCRQLFGVSTSTFAAVTYKMTGEYTVEEMKRRIEVWKQKGVK